MTPNAELDPLDQSMGAVWPERDIEGTRVIFEQILATGESINADYQYLSPNGESRYYTARVLPIRWKDSPAILQVFWETTQLKKATKDLQERERRLIEERNRLLAIMAAAPVGMAIYDTEGGILQSNEGYEQIWGKQRPSVRSLDDYERYKAWWAHSGKRVRPEEWASAQALKGETVIGQYMRIQKFNGSHSYILNSGAPVRDAKGEVAGAVVAIMDVSAYVEAEQALRETQGRFRVALSALPMMVYMMDDQLRYTWIYNPHPVFEEKNFLGKRDIDLFARKVAEPFILPKRQVIETGESLQREVPVQIEDEIKTYLLTIEPLFDSGRKVIGLIGASLDVTDQKRIQKERLEAIANTMVQRQLLENREKERQSIARDLHDGPIQLLSSTLFNLQIVKEALDDDELQAEISQASKNLKTAIRNLRNLMNELRPPALIRFGFVKSARMHAEDFRDQNPNVELYLQMMDDGDALSEDAHLALFRIYQESLNNIIKHASATKIWVNLRRKGNEMRLQIHDNGQGFNIPPYFNDQVEAQHYGLAGMKERTEALGGKFQVLSVPGVGTTIIVTIPIMNQNKDV